MELSKKIESYKEDMIEALQGLIQIKSVEEEAKEGMPFGEGPYKALKYTLKLGKTLGFKTKNIDNYAGHIEYGRGDEIVGVLVHLDVVSEGEEPWQYPPYVGEVHDGKLYGRGAIDNKGPAIGALYALKAIKEAHVPLNKKIRLILGTNEETGWGGIEYYLKEEKEPTMAFTPDSDFPVIFAEKGILVFDLVKDFEDKGEKGLALKSLKGGTASNMVADKCTAVIQYDDVDYIANTLKKYADETGYNLTSKIKGNTITITSSGKSAHGAVPEKGTNAISRLMMFLSQLSFTNNDLNDFIRLYAEHIGMGYYGKSMGCGYEDEISGKLTFNVGKIKVDDKEGRISVNVRYPISIKSQQVLDIIKAKGEAFGFSIDGDEDMKPKYIPKDHQLVETLMNVYKKHTGDNESQPIAIGGGTYARAIKSAVAFGPVFHGQEALVHQKNEYIKISLLIKASAIFADAMCELAK